MSNSAGNWIIIAGIAIVLVGLFVKTGLLSWFGNLPGDIHLKREGFQFFLPITSMLVISIILSVLGALLRRFF